MSSFTNSGIFEPKLGSLYYVRWIDSALVNEQVDTADLPTPNIIRTVGWLSKNADGYVVISRDDHSESDNAYGWRGSCAIPRECIKDMWEIPWVNQREALPNQQTTKSADSDAAKLRQRLEEL